MRIYRQCKESKEINTVALPKVIQRTEKAGYYKPDTVGRILEGGEVVETMYALYSLDKTQLV